MVNMSGGQKIRSRSRANLTTKSTFMEHFKGEIGADALAMNPLFKELFDKIDADGNGTLEYPQEFQNAVKNADIRRLASHYAVKHASEWSDTGALVVPPEPMKVHAGDPLGLVGEYNNAPSSNKKVLHLELFTADDVKAFAETAQEKYPTDTSAERPQPTSMIIPSGTVLYRKEEVAAKKVKEGVTHTNLRKAYASGEAGYNTVKEAKTGVILEIDESTLSHDRYKVLKNAGVDVSAQNWTVHKDFIVDTTYDAYTLSETRTNKERNLSIEETKPKVKDMEGKEYFELSSMYVAIEDCTPDHGITFRWVKAFDTASTDNASIFTNFMKHFKKEIGPNELSVNPLYQELFDAIDKSGNDVKGNGKIDYPLEIDKAVKSADVRKLASRYAVKHASEWGDTLQKFWDEMQTHLDGLVSSAETDKERKDRGANAKHMANQTARAKKLKFFPECKGKIKESKTTGAGAFPASDIVYFLHPIRVVGEMGISSCATNWTEGYGREISGQNKYNEWIAEAAQKYSIPCTILKSLIAQESEFNPKANNQYGYAGLTQVGGPAIAESGLNKGSTTKTNGVYVFDFANDERFDAKKSIFGGAKVLKEKRKRINLYILNGYTIQLTDDEKWKFYLAAYNGGEGVVVQAYKELGQQNAKWEDLVQETAWTDVKFKEVRDKIDKHYKKHNDYVENYNKTHTHKKKKWKVRTDTEWTSIKNTTQYSPLLVSLLYQTWGGKAKYDEVSGYVENIMARKNQ